MNFAKIAHSCKKEKGVVGICNWKLRHFAFESSLVLSIALSNPNHITFYFLCVSSFISRSIHTDITWFYRTKCFDRQQFMPLLPMSVSGWRTLVSLPNLIPSVAFLCRKIDRWRPFFALGDVLIHAQALNRVPDCIPWAPFPWSFNPRTMTFTMLRQTTFHTAITVIPLDLICNSIYIYQMINMTRIYIDIS